MDKKKTIKKTVKKKTSKLGDVNIKSKPLPEHWEKAILHYFKTRNKSDAYRNFIATKEIKPDNLWARASQFFSDPRVSAKIEELKKVVNKQVLYTYEHYLEDIDEAILIAKQEGQSSTVLQSAKAKAEIGGLLDKTIEVQEKASSVADEDLAILKRFNIKVKTGNKEE